MLSHGAPLRLMGIEDVSMNEVLAEATAFMSECYGSKIDRDMSEMRYDV